MPKQIIIHKGRTVTIPVSLGYDVSGDEFKSEIRTKPSASSNLIAEWDVTFLTDGTDGELELKLDNSVSAPIQYSVGYMDLKRITGGEPVSVFDEPLEVIFQDMPTA